MLNRINQNVLIAINKLDYQDMIVNVINISANYVECQKNIIVILITKNNNNKNYKSIILKLKIINLI